MDDFFLLQYIEEPALWFGLMAGALGKQAVIGIRDFVTGLKKPKPPSYQRPTGALSRIIDQDSLVARKPITLPPVAKAVRKSAKTPAKPKK